MIPARPAVAILALSLSGLPAWALQGGVAGKPGAWSENAEYLVEVNGSILNDAHLYTALGASAVLIVAPEFESPLIIRIQGREVLALAPSAVTEGGTPDEVHVNDAETRGQPMPFTQVDDGIVFYSSDDRVRIFRRPPIIGSTTVEEILTHPAYLSGMNAYEPSQKALSVLRSFTKPATIEVFFGSWCPHCKRTVPTLMKTFSEVDNPKIQVTYIGVPPPPFKDFAPAKEKDIEGVPAFIVAVEGVEVGRVQRIPSGSTVEDELAKILEESK